MKRYIALFSILVVFASLLVGCDLNRMGKDEYYVQITVDGKEVHSKADNGQKFKDYEYKLTGFDKDGKRIRIYSSKIFVRSIPTRISLR